MIFICFFKDGLSNSSFDTADSGDDEAELAVWESWD